MTTYVLDSMLVHEQYDIVGEGEEQTWELQEGMVYQSGVGLVTSNDTDVFGYTSLGITEDNEISAFVGNLGFPYAIMIPELDEYVKLCNPYHNSASVFTMNWTDGAALSATVLAITWEWVDYDASTADTATLVIQLTGDDLPTLADYAELGTFLDNLDSKSPTAPLGYQAGDTIPLFEVTDYDHKIQNDLIRGEASNDTLFGGLGEDTIAGNMGDDVIIGGVGRDTLRGGEGIDDISGGKRGDLIFGGDGDDMIRGQKGNDTVYGGDGADFVKLGGGKRDVFIDNGEDGPGSVGDDTVFGGDGRDIMKGRGGDDEFYGENGNDKLRGGIGNDALYGGDGDDTLNGGAGDDTMTGGEGADVFRFRNMESGDVDVIRDFELGVDIIEMYDGYDEFATYSVLGGTDALVTLSSGAAFVVEGITDIAQLQAEIEAQL